MKLILTCFLIFDFLYQCMIYVLNDAQRKKELPKEVSDVYDEKRYQTFLAYKSEYRKVGLMSKLITMAIDFFLIYSNFFMWIESITINPYLSILFKNIVYNK